MRVSHDDVSGARTRADAPPRLLRVRRALPVAQQVAAAGGPEQAVRLGARYGVHVHAVIEGEHRDIELSVAVQVAHRRRRGNTDAVAVRTLVGKRDVEEEVASVVEGDDP